MGTIHAKINNALFPVFLENGLTFTPTNEESGVNILGELLRVIWSEDQKTKDVSEFNFIDPVIENLDFGDAEKILAEGMLTKQVTAEQFIWLFTGTNQKENHAFDLASGCRARSETEIVRSLFDVNKMLASTYFPRWLEAALYHNAITAEVGLWFDYGRMAYESGHILDDTALKAEIDLETSEGHKCAAGHEAYDAYCAGVLIQAVWNFGVQG